VQTEKTLLEGVVIFAPKRLGDERGFFVETYNKATLNAQGVNLEFVQDNHSLSRDVGTLRGLHFQSEPFGQDKLVRCSRGRILDVAVDLRRSSPTFRRHVAVELSAENGRQMLVPVGFAHGFCTMEPDTEVQYKVTNYYSPANDHGVAFDDPEFAIAWPVDRSNAILSAKDRALPRLKDLAAGFA
jgi:dTDP-4-dehydrorhamnose 3,5-epimerase